ncbi:MAG: hypothetical protein Q7T87_15845 [Polaromonas sp.]|nr:hypothetical protein [Polaromonas sp.]
MAEVTARSRNLPLPLFSRAHAEQQLVEMKRRLRRRFPTVKASHLVEAIASAHGFNTYAALLADLKDPMRWPMGKPFDAQQFRLRLLSLGYPVARDFTFGAETPPSTPPAHVLEWLDELRRLDRNAPRHTDRIRQLQQSCASELAAAFALGEPKNDSSRTAKSLRWYAGIDHAAVLPGWGNVLNNRRGGGVDFPGNDHRAHFFQPLPVASGQLVEYQSAMVSMPYADSISLPRELEKAQDLAGLIGWTFSIHPQWSWHAPGRTTLVLFRPASSHAEKLDAWQGSFKRWMVENATALKRSAGTTRRKVITDVVDCQHLPLDLQDFDDCRERYLKEFASDLYFGHDAPMALVFERLMTTWAAAKQ